MGMISNMQLLEAQVGKIADINISATSCSRGAALCLDIQSASTAISIPALLSTAQIVPVSQLMIAVDLGTTFSAIAYNFTVENRNDPGVFTEWPGIPGLKAPNTPALIDYRNDKSAFTWGYRVDPKSVTRIEGNKHLLHPGHALPLYISSLRNIQRLGKSPVDVVLDYIGALYQHAMTQITHRYPKPFVDMQQKKFIMTHPAVWPDEVKDRILRVSRSYYVWKLFRLKPYVRLRRVRVYTR